MSAANSNKASQVKQKELYDKSHCESRLKVGDLVLGRVQAVPRELSKKFNPRWYGPCVIMRIFGDEVNQKAVELFDCESLTRKKVSIKNVKPYIKPDNVGHSPEHKNCNNQEEDEGATLQSDSYRPDSHLILFDEVQMQTQQPLESPSILDLSNLEDFAPITSSPKRVTINDDIETLIYQPGNDQDESIPEAYDRQEREQGDSTEEHFTSLEGDASEDENMDATMRPLPDHILKSKYYMDIDNSIKDPTYAPPREPENGFKSSQPRRGNHSKEAHVSLPKTVTHQSLIPSAPPNPDSGYNLRPRKIATNYHQLETSNRHIRSSGNVHKDAEKTFSIDDPGTSKRMRLTDSNDGGIALPNEKEGSQITTIMSDAQEVVGHNDSNPSMNNEIPQSK